MKVKRIKKIEKEDTYDLSIQDNHNYYVGNSEILVHNSGKDPSKVDRSGAYMARYIAKNLVAAGVAERLLVQISYSIGVAEPISIYVNSYNTGVIGDDDIVDLIKSNFNLTPYRIIETLKLKNPIYTPTSSYGHFGRNPYTVDGIEYFTWEKLDMVEKLRNKLKIV